MQTSLYYAQTYKYKRRYSAGAVAESLLYMIYIYKLPKKKRLRVLIVLNSQINIYIVTTPNGTNTLAYVVNP